ncbi:trehalose-6-phosphate synthase [Sulfurimonas sp.]|uniref:alpha,alpha-trehalose-phosphate synthase (UDP-forming) n=1 Tax=Sulfurimonas sp. TaxID=2022749 RepID=UPI0035691E9F
MQNKKHARLIIVSNRLPAVVKKGIEDEYKVNHASGGLVTAMTPVLKRDGGIWIGWAGNYKEEGLDVEKLLREQEKDLNYKYKPVDISLNEYELYYKGFSNEVLWPLFHNVSVYCKFSEKYYKAYQKVNREFANKIMQELADEDFIWIHDYHLINTGKELRQKGVKNKIAFFLHIPFPPLETFNRMPWRLKIIKALLSYDLIGFQTEIDKKNFLEVVESLVKQYKIKHEELNITNIITKQRESRVGVFPISIDYDEFFNQAKSEEVSKMTKEIKEGYPEQKIILGVDRLDYSKGIPNRLKVYRRLLDRNPKLRKKVKLIQVIVPSREDIVKYASLKKEIEELVGEINGKFSQLGWIPIQYIYHSLSRVELLSYYRASDIALVTPLKDGMNLIAKEYCVANFDKNGVLILSEFAGAKHQFKSDALLVNPFDEDAVVNSIKRALLMQTKEKYERMENLQNIVKKFDIYWWVDMFLKTAKIIGKET